MSLYWHILLFLFQINYEASTVTDILSHFNTRYEPYIDPYLIYT